MVIVFWLKIMKKIYFYFNFIERVGSYFYNGIVNIGKSIFFLRDVFFFKINFKKDFGIFIKQFYLIGVLSMSLIIVSALFIGMVVGLQGSYIIQNFGSDDVVIQMSCLTIVRELGPVVSAILFTGRTGSALTAEICLMKSTDQISAMEIMGISPIRKIIIPRFWAGFFSMLCLSIIFIFIAFIGVYLSVTIYLNIDSSIFWYSVKAHLDCKSDLFNSFIKSGIFSFLIIFVSLFQGINSIPDSKGISRATTNTVVYSIFLILIFNFFLTSIMF